MFNTMDTPFKTSPISLQLAPQFPFKEIIKGEQRERTGGEGGTEHAEKPTRKTLFPD